MRRVRIATARIVAVAAVALVTAACFPQDALPVAQSLPPGGRVIATGLSGADMWIEDTNDDLSAVVYGQNYPTFGQPSTNGRYWIYDDDTRASTLLPVRQDIAAGPSGVSVSPDGRWVVFVSPDPALQLGPVARNCWRSDGLFQGFSSIYCAELYRYDLDTGHLTQLTGLDGSSSKHHYAPKVSPDGRSVAFEWGPLLPETGSTPRRLDLETGVIEDTQWELCCTWDRGTHDVVWDPQANTLTSVHHATGEVTHLFGGGEPYWYRPWSSDDGRFVVLGRSTSTTRVIYQLVDTDTGTVRDVLSPWLSEDAGRYVLLQQNVAPAGDDRLVLGPVKS